jgi:phospholipase D1/2
MMSGLPGASNKMNVHQLLDESGNAATAMHTNTLWVDTSETNVFAQPTSNDKISSFTTGIEYFTDLIAVCDSASEEILIAGWQVNWDALLMPRVRLYDLLLRCAKRGVKICVMPWNDHEPIQTYDDQTKIVLEHINTQLPKNSKGHVFVTLCGSFASINGSYFSHHQKQVVVDRKYAYVGGIDLAYGRMDDATYNLKADADGRQSLNRYNPGIPPLQALGEKDIVDPDKISGKLDSAYLRLPLTSRELIKSAASIQIEKINKGKFQVRYGGPGIVDIAADSASVSSNKPLLMTLDAGRQPRMPWQDIHCKIEGPAVSDLLRNFIARWNVVAKNKLVAALPPTSFAKAGDTEIQVLRSAPAAQCKKESNQTKSGTQKDIYTAMKSLIKNSSRFIYIENQFFFLILAK